MPSNTGKPKTIKKAVKKAPVKGEKKVTTPLHEAIAVKAIPAKRSMSNAQSVKADVIDVTGKVIESMTLSSEIFGAKINPQLMSQAVRVYLANQRQGSASTKTRGEVRGSTRKIYRQKGTGRARHGGARAPIFVHGGIAHGPKPTDFSLKLSKKMRKASLFSALTAKLQDNEVKIITGLEKLPPKTKEMAVVFKNLAVDTKRQKVLMVLPNDEKNNTHTIIRIARNIDGVTYTPAALLTTYDVLNTKVLLFVKDALSTLENHFLRKDTAK